MSQIHSKAEILSRLRREVLSLEGFKPLISGTHDPIGIANINDCFPQKVFPTSALHEFICKSNEELTASSAFIAGLLSSIMLLGGKTLWITSRLPIFPHALVQCGVRPQNVIFLHLTKEKDVVKAIEEALRCKALTSVVAELPELSFTASRRFQLAIEATGISCLLLRYKPRNLATASVTRWHIRPVASKTEYDLPGIGYPSWKVDLQKVRNGRAGSWDLSWQEGQFKQIGKLSVVHTSLQKKTG